LILGGWDIVILFFSIAAMAATITAIRKNRTFSDKDEADENLLDNLISRVPPQETWEAEFCLGMLVAG
jgi:hypothetical protein